MHQIWLIIQREYFVQIKQKSFIIITIFAPIFLYLLISSLYYINKNYNKKLNLGLVNESIYNDLSLNILKNKKYNTLFTFIKKFNKNDFFKKTKHQNIDALIIIPNKNIFSLEDKILLYTNNKYTIDNNVYNIINELLNNSIRKIKLLDNGFNKNILKKINTRIKLKIYYLNNKKILNLETKKLLSIIMMYIIMMFILIYGVRIMRNIIEEKNNKIIEIIISSVEPYKLMIGKLIGTSLIALTQFIFWGFLFFIILYIYKIFNLNNILIFYKENFEITNFIQNIFNINYIYFINIFILYFIGGYLLFSSFFAIIGSIIDPGNESNNYSILISLFLGFIFYVGILTSKNNNNLTSFILSLFPLTSPIIMISRIPYDPPKWEIILSLITLYITIILFIKISSNIYSKNILTFKSIK